jgi:hypothetical protein
VGAYSCSLEAQAAASPSRENRTGLKANKFKLYGSTEAFVCFVLDTFKN